MNRKCENKKTTAFRQTMKLLILLLQTILSLPTTNNELLQKLKAYQTLTGISDELMMQYFQKVGAFIDEVNTN